MAALTLLATSPCVTAHSHHHHRHHRPHHRHAMAGPEAYDELDYDEIASTIRAYLPVACKYSTILI